MAERTLSFLAIILTALALVPAGAHLLALPNKVDLAQDAYFAAQGLYRGWALLGIVLVAALLANLVCAILLRDRPLPFALSACAFVCLAATLVIFFVWTYPANQATADWTRVPANWQALRAQWEYSHAVSALVILIALCFATGSSFAEKTSSP